MCGIFHVDKQSVEAILHGHLEGVITGDVRPGDNALVLEAHEDGIVPAVRTWGMTSRASNRLMINARAETVFERPMFARHITSRRCLVVADRFYETSPHRERYAYSFHEKGLILMGALYDESGRFVILTTAANESVRPVHDRMPVLLGKSDIRKWLERGEAYKPFLAKAMPILTSRPVSAQMSLFDGDVTNSL